MLEMGVVIVLLFIALCYMVYKLSYYQTKVNLLEVSKKKLVADIAEINNSSVSWESKKFELESKLKEQEELLGIAHTLIRRTVVINKVPKITVTVKEELVVVKALLEKWKKKY